MDFQNSKNFELSLFELGGCEFYDYNIRILEFRDTEL